MRYVKGDLIPNIQKKNIGKAVSTGISQIGNVVKEAQNNQPAPLHSTPFDNPVTNVFKPYMVKQTVPQRAPDISKLPRPTNDVQADIIQKNTDYMDKNYPMKGFTKPVPFDSIKKEQPSLLDIPVMAAKAALEIPEDLKNLSIYGTRALGEFITGNPVESYRPEGYSIVNDILPESWGKAINEFEKNNPFWGGFVKFGVENGLDPQNFIGGGTMGELSKALQVGKNTTKGIKLVGDMNKAIVEKMLSGKALTETEQAIVDNTPQLKHLQEGQKRLMLP